MSDAVIRAEGLGKAYQIRHEVENRPDRFSEMLTERAKRLFRGSGNADPSHETFWALRDISFEIREGEVVGIIGRNGAGKSTLLKILSRITEPTEGRVEIRGRVASLLEVGTGFHPELTGRENVFLNGAILGMSRTEIRRKFDEIVDFAGVEKFLDTPVKRYSTGMGVRLAFAVAAHLEPEILVVDEVLAVGDVEFQRKCLGKMGEVASGGRTVLFVSHNMAAIQRLCQKSLLLVNGYLGVAGPTSDVIEDYQSSIRPETRLAAANNNVIINRVAGITEIEAFVTGSNPPSVPITWKDCTFRIHYTSKRTISKTSVVFYIYDAAGRLLQLCSTRPDNDLEFTIREGNNYVDLEFPNLMLAAGTYMVGAGLAYPKVAWIDHQPMLRMIEVGGQDVFDSGLPPRQERYPVVLPHRWHIVAETFSEQCADVLD